MPDKIKALLHMAAVFAIFFLTDSFCSEIIGIAFRLCDCALFIFVLYICLHILNVWTAVFLYSKYVLRMSLTEIYLGKPFLDLRWCIAAVVLPFVIDAVYVIFTKGECKIGCDTLDRAAYLLFHEIFSAGLRVAMTQGMLFRGLLFRILQKAFGNKAGILVSSLFYAAASYIFYNSFAWTVDYGMFVLTFFMGLAFVLITYETGSVWPSVLIHFFYNTFSGGSYLLHIDAKQDFPALFSYTVKSGGIFFTDIPMPDIVAFIILMMISLLCISLSKQI